MQLSLRTFATVCCVAVLAITTSTGCGQTSNKMSDPESDQYFSSGDDFAGSHILVAWEGSERAGESVTRTKEEALAKANELIQRVNSDPDSFAEIAKEESDGPSADRGGSLGSWKKGRMVPAFDVAVEALDVGAVTSEPVETQFGYHVIRRDPTKVKYYAAHGIIISYAGMPQLPPTITRTKDQADSLAKSLEGKITTSNFDEMAAEYNDVLDKPVFLGAFTEDAQLPEGLLDAIQGMDYGDVAGPIEFPIGYVFVKRAKAEQLAGSHILVSYAGAERAAESTTRTKDEAATLAADLAEQLEADPTQFETLATSNSDDNSGAGGGSLGVWFKGAMVPVFDSTLAMLSIGDISGAIESPFGYHVIRRDSVPQ